MIALNGFLVITKTDDLENI